ncbi:MAG: hypothetical protein GX936_03225 [Clostridiales bacterium]|jgi:hypothetical protein|nr:hypothetical protein [Clostridiales bacterium]
MKQIDTLDHWYTFADMLSAAGYRLSSSQGNENGPEGFQARFLAPGRPDLEISTHNADVYSAMLKYKPRGFERG